jgi:hypothetical protein
MLASLISDQWKEGNSHEPIFIDRNGRLFEYVLDYLRTNEVYLPSTVNVAAVHKDFEYYGLNVDMNQVQVTNDDKKLHELQTKVLTLLETITPKNVASNDIVHFNVGGTQYDASPNLFGYHCGSHMLASLVRNSNVSEKQSIFIDRNGHLFAYVLEYLRTGKCNLPISVSRDAVREEFEYYGIRFVPQYDQACFDGIAKKLNQLLRTKFGATPSRNLIGR